MAEIRFHPEAQADYQTALAWYQVRSQRAAERFEEETDQVLDSIAANPSMFPSYDDVHRFATLRRFPYSIVYQVQPDRIEVIAFAHSQRKPGYWQGRT